MNEKEFLLALINDERNSALFYAYLSTLAESGEIKPALENIALECGMGVNRLLGYCKTAGIEPNNDFGDIEKNISVGDGIKWAVEVENKSIERLESFKNRVPYKHIYSNKKKRLLKLKRCTKIIDL